MSTAEFNAGWNCGSCGTWVPLGCVHSCQGTLDVWRTTPYPAPTTTGTWTPRPRTLLEWAEYVRQIVEDS